jgi:hypothetical protein
MIRISGFSLDKLTDAMLGGAKRVQEVKACFRPTQTPVFVADTARLSLLLSSLPPRLVLVER